MTAKQIVLDRPGDRGAQILVLREQLRGAAGLPDQLGVVAGVAGAQLIDSLGRLDLFAGIGADGLEHQIALLVVGAPRPHQAGVPQARQDRSGGRAIGHDRP